MAMLEAFMYDPLLDWGLTADEDEQRGSSSSVAVQEFKTEEVKVRADRNAGSEPGFQVRRALHVEQSQQDERLLNERAVKVLGRIRSKVRCGSRPAPPCKRRQLDHPCRRVARLVCAACRY